MVFNRKTPLFIVLALFVMCLFAPKLQAQTVATRPGIFLNESKIESLVLNIENDTYTRSIFESIKKVIVADRKSLEALPQDAIADDIRSYEQWGPRVALYALILEKQGDPKAEEYFTLVKNSTLQIIKYPSWSKSNSGDSDLQHAHLLIGVSLVYDWLYEKFTPEERILIEKKLFKETNKMQEYLLAHKQWIFSNHYYWDLASIAVATEARNRPNEAKSQEWKNLVRSEFNTIFTQVLPEDGSWHEGVEYHIFAVRPILYFIETLENSQKQTFYSSPWLQKTLLWRDDMTLKNLASGVCIGTTCYSSLSYGIGDDPIVNNGKDSFQYFRLADQYNSTSLQKIGKEEFSRDQNTGRIKQHWLNLMWYNSSISSSATPENKLVSYPDLGLVLSQSDNRNKLLFKSGIIGGEKANQYLQSASFSEQQGQHDQPDQNTFVYVVDGKPLFRDTGLYKNPAGKIVKDTSLENSVTFDGVGQNFLNPLGKKNDFSQFPTNSQNRGRILETKNDNGVTYIRGEAGQAYPSVVGVETFSRNIALTEDYLAIYDKIKLSSVKNIEWHFHIIGNATVSGKRITIDRSGDIFFFDLLDNGSYEISILDESNNSNDPLFGLVKNPLTHVIITSHSKESHFTAVIYKKDVLTPSLTDGYALEIKSGEIARFFKLDKSQGALTGSYVQNIATKRTPETVLAKETKTPIVVTDKKLEPIKSSKNNSTIAPNKIETKEESVKKQITLVNKEPSAATIVLAKTAPLNTATKNTPVAPLRKKVENIKKQITMSTKATFVTITSKVRNMYKLFGI